MNRLLADLRIVELSAFVAAPLGGMTMAQMGAEVIRIDPIKGGIDFARWPVTRDGASLYWAGLNKVKLSVALALDRPEGRELARAIAAARGPAGGPGGGPGGGIVLTNLPPLAGVDYASLKAARADIILLRLAGNPRRLGRGRLHGQRRERLSAGDRKRRRTCQPCAAGLGHRRRPLPRDGAARRRAPPRAHRGGAGGHRRANRWDAGDGRPPRLYRRGGDQWPGAAGARQRSLWQLRARLRDGRRAARDDHRADAAAMARARPRHRACRWLCARWDGDGGRSRKREWPVRGARGDRRAARALVRRKARLAEIEAAFAGSGVLWGPFQDFAALVRDHPRASPANPLFAEIEQPAIEHYPMPGLPVNFGAAPREAIRPAPLLGEHTEEVLAGVLGLSASEIGRLCEAGIAARPRPR